MQHCPLSTQHKLWARMILTDLESRDQADREIIDQLHEGAWTTHTVCHITHTLYQERLEHHMCESRQPSYPTCYPTDKAVGTGGV